MKTNRTCNLLAAAIAAAMLAPVAVAQSNDATSANAAQQAQEVPRPALPPAVTPRLPVDADPRVPAATTTDPQRVEEPMTSTSPPGAIPAAASREVWAELDADGDGRISAAEANADVEFNSHFSMMDSDGDGFISDVEFRAHPQVARGQGEGPPPPPAQSQGAAHAAAHSSVVQRELWSRLDTDGDGRISSVEASMDPELSTQFRLADADGDGFMTDAEFRTHAESMPRSGDADIDEDDGIYDEGTDTGDEDPDPTVDDRDER